jgi:ATPase subunit of ABC transporter with duplicated ATPase domains
MSISASNLSLQYPNGFEPFAGVNFKVSAGDHVALVGENGAGKTTLLRIIAGELEATDGDVRTQGEVLYLSQSIGFAAGETVRGLLIETAPMALRLAGHRLLAADRAFAEGDEEAGMELALALTEWGELGGYELEGGWDQSLSRILGATLSEIADRDLTQLSGGERKRLALDVLFASSADVLLLDEPDNYLDIPSKVWLEQLIATSPKTILFISHDREFLLRTATKVLTLEGHSTWMHGAGFAGYRAARDERQTSLEGHLARWHDEERRLYDHMKLMKQRAALNPKNASRANAAESKWQRFKDAGPPPPPVRTRQISVRLNGADGSRRALTVTGLGLRPLIRPFSDVVFHGERIGLIGPNGTGKTHLLRMLNGDLASEAGTVGMFSQINNRIDFVGKVVLDIVEQLTGNFEKAMQLLARYGLERQAGSVFDMLSGGQKARLEILSLEQEGHNFLLLDEPTDNLDIESADSLQAALAEFEGTCVSVSHDRNFLSTQDRYWMLQAKGAIFALTRFEDAIASLLKGKASGNARPLEAAA